MHLVMRVDMHHSSSSSKIQATAMSRACARLLPSAAAKLSATLHVNEDSLCILLLLFSSSSSSLGLCKAQTELSPA